MTIAQRFVEMGEQLGIDTSNCKTGNIGEVLNELAQKKGGTVAGSQNISLAMMNLTKALNGETSEETTGGTEQEPTQEPTNDKPDNGEENPEENPETNSETGW